MREYGYTIFSRGIARFLIVFEKYLETAIAVSGYLSFGYPLFEGVFVLWYK
jgi:hypothetical protein